jgi:RNA polymerase sigma factor (sigma-70 family)
VEVATTSAPHASFEPDGRPGDGAAAARTELLYAQYGRTVSGLCGALLRTRAEAEDATQQTFLSAHRALLNGTEPREPAAWLATIARNECWGRIRSRMREPLTTTDVEAASPAPDPLTEAIRRADLAALWAAIEALPLQQRDAILLREFGGLSYDELAAALAVSGPAVESLLFRARQTLRAQLRTAYASLTGASWLEALGRLLAGGSAPVAAKVAALGVGAAAVSGGAVVAPQVFENHHPGSPAPARTAPRHRARPVQVAAPLAALVAAPVVVPVAAPVVERRGDAPARTVAATPTVSGGSRDEGQPQHEAVRSGASRDGERSTPETVAPPGSAESGSGSPDRHPSSGDGSPGPAERGDSGSEDDGGSHDDGGESS